jgi:hypothetical protein
MFEEFYKDDAIVLLIEWDNDVPYIHHHFYSWSVSIHKKFKSEFNKLVKYLQNKGHTELWSYYDKVNTNVDKFCVHYGFNKVGETETQNIVLKEI